MRYSPVQVKNPTSQHHLVRLLPDQELLVILTRPEYQEAEILVQSDFLFLSQDFDNQSQHFRRLTFHQRVFMPTSCFLGEILVNSPILSACLVIYSEVNDYYGGRNNRHQRQKKQLMTCPVSFNKLRCTDMETGCNVIFSRCS
jgi:hypothetical protein